MKTLFSTGRYAILISGLAFSCATASLKTKKTEHARCTGARNCKICTNCSRCQHCGNGGVCGVCSPESFNEKAKPVDEKNPAPAKKPAAKKKVTPRPLKKGIE